MTPPSTRVKSYVKITTRHDHRGKGEISMQTRRQLLKSVAAAGTAAGFDKWDPEGIPPWPRVRPTKVYILTAEGCAFMSEPLGVTIMVANYINERFLSAAIDSTLGQDYPLCEAIVDDRSTDNSRAITARVARTVACH
jgi:hypothetical protein